MPSSTPPPESGSRPAKRLWLPVAVSVATHLVALAVLVTLRSGNAPTIAWRSTLQAIALPRFESPKPVITAPAKRAGVPEPAPTPAPTVATQPIIAGPPEPPPDTASAAPAPPPVPPAPRRVGIAGPPQHSLLYGVNPGGSGSGSDSGRRQLVASAECTPVGNQMGRSGMSQLDCRTWSSGARVATGPRESGCYSPPDLGKLPDGRPVLTTARGHVFAHNDHSPIDGAHVQVLNAPYNTFSNAGEYVLHFDPALVAGCRQQFLMIRAEGYPNQRVELIVGPDERGPDIELRKGGGLMPRLGKPGD